MSRPKRAKTLIGLPARSCPTASQHRQQQQSYRLGRLVSLLAVHLHQHGRQLRAAVWAQASEDPRRAYVSASRIVRRLDHKSGQIANTGHLHMALATCDNLPARWNALGHFSLCSGAASVTQQPGGA